LSDPFESSRIDLDRRNRAISIVASSRFRAIAFLDLTYRLRSPAIERFWILTDDRNPSEIKS
jgi:hypothetical protein